MTIDESMPTEIVAECITTGLVLGVWVGRVVAWGASATSAEGVALGACVCHKYYFILIV